MSSASEAIVKGYKSFELAFINGDPETIASMYTDDAELLIPEAPTFKGREAIGQVWKNIVGDGGTAISVSTAEVQESGDWAYEVGTFTATSAEGKILNAGKYIVIWKQQSAGDWKIHRDIFNWDIPPVQT